jgi:hypothetical protein
MELDKHTFGKSDAAIVLADLLNKANNTKQTRKVSAFLQMIGGFRRDLLALEAGSRIEQLARKAVCDLINSADLAGIDAKIMAYTKNVAFSRIP